MDNRYAIIEGQKSAVQISVAQGHPITWILQPSVNLKMKLMVTATMAEVSSGPE